MGRWKLLWCVTAWLWTGMAHAQGDLSQGEIKIHKVTGNISLLEGAGGNIGVSVGEDGIILIDDQFAGLTEKIEAALKTLSDKPVRFVLNTHWHGDHTGGNENFGKSAAIIAHDKVRSRMKTGAQRGNQVIPPAAPGALPLLTFDQSLSLHLNGEEIRVIHYPAGHTDGDSVVYFTASKVVHMGDNFFNKRFPFIDLESGGTVQGVIKAVEAVIKKMPPDAHIIPGHGPLGTIADLKAYLDMLVDARKIVSSGMKKGKSLEALKKEKVLDRYASWSWDFIPTDRFLEVLYTDLSRKAPAR